MRKITLFSMLWLLAAVLLLLIQSCKKDDQLGLDLINLPGDRLGLAFTDTTTVLAWTVPEDSVQTSGVYLNLLGSYRDPVFGKVTAGLYTGALLSTNNVSFGTNPVGDSLVLTLQYNGYYGDSMKTHRLRIYEIDPGADFHKDTVFYSNDNLPLGEKLYDQNIVFNAVDSVDFNGDRVGPLLKVKLGGNLMQKFLDASGTSDLQNNDAFREFFKGLYAEVEEVNSINEGSIAYFNLNADLSRLTFYYHNDLDTLTYPFVINDQCAQFSAFNHFGYSGLTHILQQDTTGYNNKTLYLQSMGGLKIRIHLPYLEDLNFGGKAGVTRAELVLKPDPDDLSSDMFAIPPKLSLARFDDDGSIAFISDVLEGETFLGGTYDPVKEEYRFRITRHLHDILSGRYNNNGLVVLVSGASINAYRAVIMGNSALEKNLKLEIVYTKL